MKKIMIGALAIGAIIALRSLAGRGGEKMREHCQQMAGKCKQMMAGQSGEGGETAPMREHCREMAAQFGASGGTAEEPVHREEVAAQI